MKGKDRSGDVDPRIVEAIKNSLGQGQSISQIAKVVGVPASTVRHVVHRIQGFWSKVIPASAAVICAVATAGLFMGQAMPRAQTVEAQKFVLKDSAGKVRAVLAMDKDKDGPVLVLADENEKPRAGLGVFKDGPRLILRDGNGATPRVELGVLGLESKDWPVLVLRDENGKVRVGLTVFKDGPVLHLYDENDKPRVELDVSKDGPGLSLFNENKKIIWRVP
jgi:hypothetical protein